MGKSLPIVTKQGEESKLLAYQTTDSQLCVPLS